MPREQEIPCSDFATDDAVRRPLYLQITEDGQLIEPPYPDHLYSVHEDVSAWRGMGPSPEERL